jgi:hypothetical protein
MNFLQTHILSKTLLIVTILIGTSDSCWAMKEHLAILPEHFESLPESQKQAHVKLLEEHTKLVKQKQDLDQQKTLLTKQIQEQAENLKIIQTSNKLTAEKASEALPLQQKLSDLHDQKLDFSEKISPLGESIESKRAEVGKSLQNLNKEPIALGEPPKIKELEAKPIEPEIKETEKENIDTLLTDILVHAFDKEATENPSQKSELLKQLLNEKLKTLKEDDPRSKKLEKAIKHADELFVFFNDELKGLKDPKNAIEKLVTSRGISNILLTASKSAAEFGNPNLARNLKVFGVVAALIGPVIAAIMGPLLEKIKDQDALKSQVTQDMAKIDDLLAGKTEAKSGPDGATIKKEDDDVYNQTISSIAALFADIDKDLKNALLKQNTYNNKIFKINVGSIKINDRDTNVSIEYDFNQSGAGDLGLPFTPLVVTLSPEDIHGFTIMPEDLLSKMNDGAAKDLTALLLQPTDQLIFAIKLIQLINSGTPGEFQEDFEQAEYLLDQTSQLYSRLLLSGIDPNPATLLSDFPSVIKDVMKEKNKVKMYAKLTSDIYTPLDKQTSAFEECSSEFEQGSLADALPVFYNNAYQLFNVKFIGDTGYALLSGTLKFRAAKNYLLAIFYRGMRELAKAAKIIGSSDEENVALRKLDGTEYEINPKLAIQGLLTKPQNDMEAATSKLKDAVSVLRKIVDTAKETKTAPDAQSLADAKSSYTHAVAAATDATKSVGEKILEFRKLYAPYYPLSWSDGIKRTPAEFVVAAIQELAQHSSLIAKDFISPVYKPFKKNFGLVEVQLAPAIH